MTESELWANMLTDPSMAYMLAGASFDASKKPYEQEDITYWTDMAQVGLRGYQTFMYPVLNADGETMNHPGKETTSYLSLAKVKERVAMLPSMQEAGTATRGNELGLLRLNRAFYPECEGKEGCGISLGVTQADHKKVRPVLDEVFGTGQTDGSIGLFGNKWSRDTIRAHAKGYLQSRNKMNIKTDSGAWTAIALHKLAFNMDITEVDAKAFVTFQAAAVVLTALPAFIPDWFGGALKVDQTLANKAMYVKKYEAAIRASIASGYITTLSATDADAISKAAVGFLDATIFAGGLSVPGVIAGGLGAYYTGLTGTFNINDPLQAPLLVFESIRMYPPVLGMPYFVTGSDGKPRRHAPLVGMGGYDKTVYGADADKFKIRGDLAFYKANSIDWADTALPVDGKPWSSRVCPGKSLSYNMILSFWESMDATNWYADPANPPVATGKGPNFWNDFTVKRMCEGMGVHVGAYEASRSFANKKQGAYCSWSTWCGEGFECSRAWYQYSGTCKVNKDYKFFGETCSSNAQCANSIVKASSADLACRFGKCGFQDGNVCAEDETIVFADYTHLPASDQAGTGKVWAGIGVAGGSVGAAAVFFFKRPQRNLKHSKMDTDASKLVGNDKL